jgi:hypothetical protein
MHGLRPASGSRTTVKPTAEDEAAAVYARGRTLLRLHRAFRLTSGQTLPETLA